LGVFQGRVLGTSPVDYFSEHTNGDITEENEHDRTVHFQSEYAVGDSIKKTREEGDEGHL
jgi:hypothetical protein